jgi:glycosyltransferase involved in cell wall biosynthesis
MLSENSELREFNENQNYTSAYNSKNQKRTKAQHDKSKISLIIPVYMEESILEKILKVYNSELREKYNFEVIVSDGGSTDSTISIANKYANIIVEHKEARRQTIAEGRNAGAKAATGSTFVFINGDTYPADANIFFNFIRNWADNKTKYSKYSALACKVYVEKSEEKFSDIIFYNLFNSYVRFLNIIGIGMGRGECQIIKADIFKKVGGYNDNFAAGEDFDLYNRIKKIGKIAYTNDITVLESPRRFRKYGYIRVLYQWSKNALSVMIRGNAANKEWEVVR